MGYEVSIVRQQDYTSLEEGSNITLEEWMAYVEMDEELAPVPEDHLNGVPGVKWLAHVYEEAPEEHIAFWFWQGTVFTKSPDEKTIDKMIQMANILRAKVRGEEMEIYEENWMEEEGEELPPAEEDVVTPKQVADKKPWWKVW